MNSDKAEVEIEMANVVKNNHMKQEEFPDEEVENAPDKIEDNVDYNMKANMLYSVEDVPPIATSFLLGFQHSMMAFGGIVGLPLILASSICMFETPEGLLGRSKVVNSMLFVCGICTFVQTTFGIRLPIMQGAPYTFIAATITLLSQPRNVCPSPLFSNNTMFNGTTFYNDTDGQMVDGTELWQRRMREVQGCIAVASVFQIIVGATGMIGALTKYISPVTITVCITLLGFSLYAVPLPYCALDWSVACVTSAVLIISSQYLDNLEFNMYSFSCTKRKLHKVRVKFFKLFPVILAIAFGWLMSLIFTVTNVYPEDSNNPQYLARTDARVGVIETSVWFYIPYPFQWGVPRVSASGVAGMLAAVVAGIIESIGDYHATARISGAPVPPSHAISRATLVEGLGCLLNGLVGTAGATTSYSGNSSAIGITRVGSRRVMQAAGFLLMFLGLFGKMGAIFVMIPDPVLGGCFMVLLGMLIGVALSNLDGVDLSSHRNVFILGFSIFIGIMLPQFLHTNPGVINTSSSEFNEIVTVLLKINLLVGGSISLFFDLTLPGERSQKFDRISTSDKDLEKRLKSCYNLPFSTNFRFAKYIPFLPQHDGLG